MSDKIAICITTRNRPESFKLTWHSIFRFMPKGGKIFIVDDASDVNYTACIGDYRYRFDNRVGIPKAKNKCIELAMEWGATDIFLFDDDTYPIEANWHLPYMHSPYLHLNYTFLHSRFSEHGHKIHSLGNGCMMYIKREVINKIGGFDTRFGIGKYEHPHFSYRAYAAGFIPHPFMDVVDSDKLIYCMDQDNSVKRTMSPKEMATQLNNNREHYYKTRMSTEFVPYK